MHTVLIIWIPINLNYIFQLEFLYTCHISICRNPTIQNTFTRSHGTTSKNDKPFIVIALYESHGSTFPAYCHVNACIQP